MHWLAKQVERAASGDSFDAYLLDQDFILSFARTAPDQVWELIESLSPDDGTRMHANCGILFLIVNRHEIGRGGALPPWYDMKPSEYQDRKEAICRKLEEIEKEISIYAPEISYRPALDLLWPQREIPLKNSDPLLDDTWDDLAWNYYAKGNDGVRKVASFYSMFPDEEPRACGQGGMLDRLREEIRGFEPERYGKPKSGPAWCRHFVMHLNHHLAKDEEFGNLSHNQRYKLIDHCLHFFGKWIEDPLPDGAWDPIKIKNSVGG